jgi:hypothetical protein
MVRPDSERSDVEKLRALIFRNREAGCSLFPNCEIGLPSFPKGRAGDIPEVNAVGFKIRSGAALSNLVRRKVL